MQKFICLAVIFIIINNSSAQKKSLQASAHKTVSLKSNNGFKVLFDGKTLNGWHGYGKPNASPDWVVADGAITLRPDKTIKNRRGNDLVTDDEYENFDLKLDWKIGPKGNSGIIFYINEDSSKYPETYNTGIEMQVLDNGTPTRPGHDDAKLYTHRAGDLYDLLASKEAIHPQGEWNHAEIICINGKLDFYMNGVHTLSTTLWNDNWKKMIAVSKFKNMPEWGTFKRGKISLQDHGEEVSFKNIRIKKLN